MIDYMTNDEQEDKKPPLFLPPKGRSVARNGRGHFLWGGLEWAMPHA